MTATRPAFDSTVDILLFSVEQGRFGPPRLPEALSKAGLSVGALCPAENLLAASRHLHRHDALPTARTLSRLGGALCEVVQSANPRLIIPGDEQAVMIMQALVGVRGRHLTSRSHGCDDRVAATIAASLGDPAHYDGSLLKTRTLAVARSIGVPIPRSVTVFTARGAVAAAAQMGYPVYLKESFSWAGRGVTRCDDAASLRDAFNASRKRFGPLRHLARWMADRAWYPVETETDIQSGVAGSAAMVCALAWQGRMVAGVCAEKLALTWPNGPSAAVRMRHDPPMVQHAARMIEVLGLHGFVSFDFMVPDDGSEALLLECNPRPVAIVHLGHRVGVDFADLLARLVRGDQPPGAPVLAEGHAHILLFPHSLDAEWVRMAEANGWHLDVPSSEPALLATFCAQAKPAPAAAPAPRHHATA